MHKHIKSSLQAARISTISIAAVLTTTLMLSAPVIQAKEKPADDANWSEWNALGDGYVARRRQPPKLELPKAERKLANVQDRLYKLLKQKERLLAKKVKPGKQTKKRDKQLAVLDKRIAKQLDDQTRITSKISSSALAARASTFATSSKTAWLRTGQEGLYEVSIADLAAELGKNVDQVKRKASKGTLALTTAEQLDSETATRPVFWYYDESSESILFVGEAYETFYSDENAYKIKLVGKNSKIAKPMNSVEGEGPVYFGSETAFRETLKFEEEPDLFYSLWSVASEHDADFWWWDYLYGGYKDLLEVNLSIPNPALLGTARLRVTLRGWTDIDGYNEHEVYAELNGKPVGSSVTWDGFQQAVLIADFDQGILDPSGNNTLSLRNRYAAGTHPGQWLDQVEVDYQRKPVVLQGETWPVAMKGKLWMHNVESGTQSVSGFTSNDIVVVESPGGAAILRNNVRIESDGLDVWSANFDAAGGTDFLLQERTAIPAVLATADNGAKLRDHRNNADYLILAPRIFSDTAEALASYRSSRYSNVKITWLDDIYNEFSAGREDPAAVARFVTHTIKKWSTAPSVVVLLGKGSLDQIDRMGYADNFMPVLMTATPWSLAASDSRLLGFEDEPPFAFGRLPITNDVEGVVYVEKLIRYETAISGSERFEAVLVADNPDDAGEFHDNSELLASRLLDSLGFDKVTRLYHPDVNVRSELSSTETWNVGYVSYDGHGSSALIGDYSENFISDGDAELLVNSTYPIFTALTCAAANDTSPGERSLAGALVLNPGGGAIAAVASTGASLDAEAQILGNALVDSLFGSSNTIGQALKGAKTETSGRISEFMPRTYSVVGEPSVYAR